MVASTMKAGSLEREKKAGAAVCPYGPISVLGPTLVRFDELMQANPHAKHILTQKENYATQMILMEAFFRDFDGYLGERKENLKENVMKMCQGEEKIELPTIINFFVTRIILFHMLRFSREKIHNHRQKELSPEAQKFFLEFQILIGQYVGHKDNAFNIPATWEIIWNFLIEKYTRENPDIYYNPYLLRELFWEYLSQAFDNDKKIGFANDEIFDTFLKYSNILIELDPQNEKDEKPILLTLLSNSGLGFQILYAMIGSVAEQFQEQACYKNIDEATKKKMFFSIKRDFLVEARFWSKQFLDDNIEPLYGSESNMVWFGEKTSKMPTGKLIFDFKQAEISLDASTYPTTPLRPDIKTIRRGCPVAFVAGEGLGGNFLARQIDTALEIIYEVYLKEKN